MDGTDQVAALAGDGFLWGSDRHFAFQMMLLDDFQGEFGLAVKGQHGEEDARPVGFPEVGIFQLDEVPVKETLLFQNGPGRVAGEVVCAVEETHQGFFARIAQFAQSPNSIPPDDPVGIAGGQFEVWDRLVETQEAQAPADGRAHFPGGVRDEADEVWEQCLTVGVGDRLDDGDLFF